MTDERLSAVHRYKLVHDSEYQSQMLRRSDGEWVKYRDVANLIEAQAAELATLRAERDGSAGVRIQDIAQYLLDHLPSYADHPAWDAMQDAVDDGLDEDDCIRAWLRAIALKGGA